MNDLPYLVLTPLRRLQRHLNRNQYVANGERIGTTAHLITEREARFHQVMSHQSMVDKYTR